MEGHELKLCAFLSEACAVINQQACAVAPIVVTSVVQSSPCRQHGESELHHIVDRIVNRDDLERAQHSKQNARHMLR